MDLGVGVLVGHALDVADQQLAAGVAVREVAGPARGQWGGVPTEVCLPTAERTNRFLAAFESPSVAVRASRRGCMCNWWDFHAVPQPHREVITTNSEVENFANLNCRV